MAHMKHETAPAHHRAIEPAWGDAQIVGNLQGQRASGGNAIHVGGSQSGLCQRVASRLRVELNHRTIMNHTDAVALSRPDNGDLASMHRRCRMAHTRSPSSGWKTGSAISPRR